MNLAKMIDHTCLKADATAEHIVLLCNEAKKFDFKAVCINPSYVAFAKEQLKDTEIAVATVVGFPLGANRWEIKREEALLAIADGADEIDMVQNIAYVKDGRFDLVEAEIKKIREALPKEVVLKVILETCLLSDDEIVESSRAAQRAGADFIKTSTGFSTGGAKVEDILLMRKTVGEDMQIKASGGIRDLNKALSMLEAGANRLGISSSVSIMRELEERDEI